MVRQGLCIQGHRDSPKEFRYYNAKADKRGFQLASHKMRRNGFGYR